MFIASKFCYNCMCVCVPAVVREVKKKGSYVVLFAHGHMGTFEQFRSMASETAKEIVRRIKSGDNKVDWIDWYSADFNEEPSGLEQRILVRLGRGFLYFVLSMFPCMYTLGLYLFVFISAWNNGSLYAL